MMPVEADAVGKADAASGSNSASTSDGGMGSHDVLALSTLSSAEPKGTSSRALISKIEAFDKLREEERKRMFYAVLFIFKILMGTGGTVTAAGILGGQALEEPYITKIAYALGAVFIAYGLVVASACPADLLNVNAIMTRHWKTRVAISISAFGLGPLMQAPGNFPHLEVLLVLTSIGIGFSGWSRLPSWFPLSTTWVTMWTVIYPICWGSIYLFPQEYQEFEPVSYAVAGVYLLMAVVMMWMWRRRIHSGQRSDALHGMAMYEVMYACLMTEGVADGLNGATKMVLFDSVEGTIQLSRSFSILTPTIGVLLIGRFRLFTFLGRALDRDGARMRRDGAFIAELLDTVAVNVGQVWWVQRDGDDDRYRPSDIRRRWQQGLITEVIETNEFVVQLPREEVESAQIAAGTLPANLAASFMGGPTLRMDMSSTGGKTKEALLLQAQGSLRCVDFENLSLELMKRSDAQNNPELQAKWSALARPLKPGEKISYFMSNSWYDDHEKKWKKVCEIAEKFHSRHGRYPTFWVDKLCIEQTAIHDGLKVLPVNVMACEKLLALCGDTYLSRLWCIWELFTLFAFVTEAAALERVEFVFLGDYDEGMEMLDAMGNFHVKDSHCYDPNEEARLREVIDAVGTSRFNKRIASMAALTRSRLEQQHQLEAMNKTFSSMSWQNSRSGLGSLRLFSPTLLCPCSSRIV